MSDETRPVDPPTGDTVAEPDEATAADGRDVSAAALPEDVGWPAPGDPCA